MNQPNRQSGVALVAAIFLIVVIGGAVTLLASLAVRNTAQSTQTLLSIRAQSAAQAGLEMAVQQLVESETCGSVTSTLTPAALPGFTVTINCNSADYGRPSQSFTLFSLTATASYGNPTDSDYVWTEINATVEL
ncbi:hypothetical protein [Saccharospirillum salsuginis]|uniref:MSHA biogenesis protein MshP n=1 Tax=Saccharospirillum salsuginis TaxID=418750 RepID=A0A918K386_9GAMM|nr:hypothetical protein [Saccharospirillum salsuginis]GGX45597.1 hypothetical protein GCM10007392_10790 [Saccharospirillum salsuginis]